MLVLRQALRTVKPCIIRQSSLISARRKMSTDSDEVVLDVVKGKGVIRLNRPKALNALNLNMINKMFPVLQVSPITVSFPVEMSFINSKYKKR